MSAGAAGTALPGHVSISTQPTTNRPGAGVHGRHSHRNREAAMATETCTWHGNPDDSGFWDTDCHNTFVLDDGTPTDNDMKFCCYCGRPLVTGVVTDEDDDDDNQD